MNVKLFLIDYGTFILACATVAAIVVPIVGKWCNRPKLSVCKPSKDTLDQISLGIKNEGRSVATDCYVTINISIKEKKDVLTKYDIQKNEPQNMVNAFETMYKKEIKGHLAWEFVQQLNRNREETNPPFLNISQMILLVF